MLRAPLTQPDTPARPGSGPRAYLITFTCYGTRLHGNKDGSVDRFRNQRHTRLLGENPGREQFDRGLLKHTAVTLTGEERAVVLETMRQHAAHRRWVLHAVHVRSNHVHVVLEADVRPEKAMTQFKAYASRALNGLGWREKRWAHHGSTRYLWEAREVDAAVDYVVHQQGPAMAVYVNPKRWVERLDPHCQPKKPSPERE